MSTFADSSRQRCCRDDLLHLRARKLGRCCLEKGRRGGGLSLPYPYGLLRLRRPVREKGTSLSIDRGGVLLVALVEIQNVACVGSIKIFEIVHKSSLVKVP